jgi:hypothetical protein
MNQGCAYVEAGTRSHVGAKVTTSTHNPKAVATAAEAAGIPEAQMSNLYALRTRKSVKVLVHRSQCVMSCWSCWS